MAVTANIQINGAPGSNDNLPLSTPVFLTNVSTPAASTYLWQILTQPEGTNTDLLSSSTASNPQFTPTKEGSYLIRLTVDQFLPSEASQQVIVGVRELETDDRIPAAGETTENSGTTGWANTAADYILQRVTRLTDAGAFVGEAGAAGIVSGTVVAASGVATIGADPANQRVVPVFTSVNGTMADIGNYELAVAIGAVVGGGTPASGALLRVLYAGLVQGITYPSSAPAVGDPVYVGDSGLLSLTQGTVYRPCGTVAAVHSGTYDVWFGGAVGSISGSPSGPAGGVLGYPGSSYPDPNGLASNSSGRIPIARNAPTSPVRLETDAQTTASTLPAVALVGSSNNGAGAGGAAQLVGGESNGWSPAVVSAGGATAAGGGLASVRGGDGDLGGGALVEGGTGDSAAGGDANLRGGSSNSAKGGSAYVEGGVGTDGGDVSITGGEGTAGAGGAVAITGGYSDSGAGGDATLSGGSSNNDVGGPATVIGGDPASGQEGGSGNVRGANSATGKGGDANVLAGNGATGGMASVAGGASSGVAATGGHATLYGGAAPAGQGGSAYVDGGVGSTENGDALIGTQSRTFRVRLGSSGKDVRTEGRDAASTSSLNIAAGTTIPVNVPIIKCSNAIPVTVTATPSVQTTGIAAGTRVTFIGGTNPVVLQRESALAGSKLRLGANTRTISQYHVLELVFDGADWCEVAFASNS